MSEPSVFISYSHRDEGWKDRLVRHLEVIRLEGEIGLWEDRQIDAGDEWLPEIEAALAGCDVAVLVVTADFLTSDFIRRQEVPALLARRAAGGVRVIPLIAEPCPWQAVEWLARLQLRPRDGRTLSAGDKHQIEADLAALALEIRGLAGRPGAGGRLRRLASGSRVEIDRLPSSVSGEFVAREAELDRLDAAWNDDAMNVVSIVAWGGVGKSALVSHWLAEMAAEDWRGAARVYGWSFFSQGTEERLASADEFAAEALRWFGDPEPPPVSPRDRGLRLAELVRRQRALLVLDGVEPLQHAPGSLAGRPGQLKDPILTALVKSLAADNPGLCVITTREAIHDLKDFSEATAPRLQLEELGVEGGAALLRRLGVEGADRDLREAAGELGGHALALTLLGTYLRRAYGGDARRWREVPLGKADARQGGHAYRVMAAYEVWFREEEMAAEIAILRLLGLFDRPAEVEALAALRAAPEVPELNEGLVGLAEDDWQWALSNLRDSGLVAPEEAGAVDAHPLVRSCFGNRLRKRHPEAWRAGHERLYEHYRRAEPELPDTVEEMAPLWAAVVHGCRAGKTEEAFNGLYWPRIVRKDEQYQIHKLGAFSADLTALAGFFARPWDEPAPGLTGGDRAWLLNTAGFELRALGRLAEAVEPMRAAAELVKTHEDWKNAAAGAGNLSELFLTLGDVPRAVASAEESVELADRSGDAFMRMANRTVLADALHQAGRPEESAVAFREAEAMQAEWQPQYPRLYSGYSFRYCDLLLARTGPRGWSALEDYSAKSGEAKYLRQACSEVLDRASYSLNLTNRQGVLLAVAVDHLSLGLARFGLALADLLDAGLARGAEPTDLAREAGPRAAEHLDRAVAGLRQAGQEDDLPRGLLARAALRRVRGDRRGAAADLAEAAEIAGRGGMRLHLCDVHLERARLHLAAGEAGDARRCLDAARALVEECGYHRRDGEVEFLEERLASAERPGDTNPDRGRPEV